MKKNFKWLLALVAMVASVNLMAETAILDGSVLTSTATAAVSTITQDEISYSIDAGVKYQTSAQATNKLGSEKSIIFPNGKSLHNTVAFGSALTKLEVYSNYGASTSSAVSIAFSSLEIKSEPSKFDVVLSLTTANKVYDAGTIPTGTKYIYVKNTSSKNAQIQLKATYTAGTTPSEKYTVTLKDDNSTLTQSSIGASITLPSRIGCTGYTFAGWTKSWTKEQDEWTTTAPTIIPAGSYTPAGNENLYPVYTKTESGSGFSKYEKVTSAPSDWSGQYLLSTGTYTATGEISSNHLTRDTYTSWTTEATSREFTLAKVGDVGYSIKFGSNYLGYSSGTNFSTNTTTPTATSTAYLWTPSINGIANVGSSSRKIADGGSDFRPYSNIPSGGATVYLYKRIEGGSTTSYISVPDCGPSTYTVNFAASPVEYGSVSQASLANVEGGTSISANGATLTVGSTNITATPTTATAQYTYTFNNWTWTPTGSTITAATTATANFNRTENSYTVSYYDGGNVDYTNKPTSVKYSDIGLTINATPKSGYSITGVSVTMGGSALTLDEDYTWEDGELMITPTNFTGNINITFTTELVQACTKEITITKGTPSNGSFTLSQEGQVCIDNGNATVSITNISPATHYHFKQITTTNGDVDDNAKTVSNITANTTINVEFEEDTKFDVKWMVNGVQSGETSKYYEGEKVSSLPTPAPTVDGCEDDKVFVGWTATPIDGVGSEPDDLFNDVAGSPAIIKNTTFYAVFADKGQGGVGPTVTKDYSLSSTGWENDTKYTTLTLVKEILTASVSGGTNTGKYYTFDNTWRLYASESATLTINSNSNYVIEKVNITWTNDDSKGGELVYNSTTVASNSPVSVNANQITFSTRNTISGKNGQVRISKIIVDYHSTTGGAPTYSNYITSCTAPTPSIIFKDGDETITSLTLTDDYKTAGISGNKTIKVVGEHLAQYHQPSYSIVDDESDFLAVSPATGTYYSTNTLNEDITILYNNNIPAGTYTGKVKVTEAVGANYDEFVVTLPITLTVNPTYTVELDNLTTGEISTTDNIVDIKAGTEINLTFTPNSPTIVFQRWIVYDENTEDIAESYISGNVLTMPAKNVTVSAETATLPQLAKVEGLEEENVTSHSATLSWTAVDNAASYSVYIIDMDEYEETIPVSETSYEIFGLVGNTTYYWTVKAIGDGSTHADGPDSEIADFTTTAPVLSSIAITNDPTNLKYKIGDTFNPTGLKINTIYDDASEVEVVYNDETKEDFSFTTIDFAQEGNTTVYVTYKGKTAAETFEVIVVDKVMITWMVGDVPYCAATEATEGGKVGALPAGTPTSPCPTHYPYFVGWTRYESVSDNPQLLSATSDAKSSFTAHAVFAKTRTLSGFEKMSNDQFDPNALYAIGAKETGSVNTMHYLSSYTKDASTKNAWGATSTEVSNAVLFTLKGTSSSLEAKTSDAWLNPVQDFQMSSTQKTISIGSNGAIFTPEGATSQYALRYNHNSGNGGFRWYAYSSTTGTTPYFYKATYTYSNLIITCPPTYDATVANEIVGGSVQISLDGVNWTSSITDQEKGTKIYLKNTPSDGYTFNKYVVTKDNEYQTDVTVTDNAFEIKDADVNVSANFDKISVTNATIVVEGGDAAKTLSLGKTLNLSLDILPVTARPTIVWSSSDEGVVTVAANDATPWAGCVVTPIATGETTVKAKIDNQERYVTIKVIAATVLDHLTLETIKTDYTLGDEFVKPKVTAYYKYAESGEEASHKVVTDDVVVTGYDKTAATVGDEKQTVTLTYTDGVSVSREIKVTVAPWKLNLVNRHLVGDEEKAETIIVDVVKLGAAIDLTEHYASLCDEYSQVGYIESEAKIADGLQPANLLTEWTPAKDEESLYGVFVNNGYAGEILVTNALTALPEGWTKNGTVEAATAADASCLKFGASGSAASLTTPELAIKGHKVKVSLDALRYNNNDDASAEACVTIDGVTKKSGTLSTTVWKSFEFEFDSQKDNGSVKIGTLNSGKRRCYIKNLVISTLPEITYTSVYDCRTLFDVTYNLNDNNTGEATCGAENAQVKEGVSYTIFAIAPVWMGHNFQGWQVNDDTENLKDPGDIITINEATTLTAQWKEIVPTDIVLPTATAINNGVTSSVTATIAPTDAYLKTITWSQSSEDGGLLELAQTTSTTGEAFSFKALNPGTVTLTATAGTIERQVVVTINKVVALTQLEATNEHRTFKMGESFVKETITAIYSDGSQSERQSIDQTKVNFSTPDMQTSGVKTVEVSYTDQNTLVSANMTYEITVTPWTLNVYSSPNKKQGIEITTLEEATTIPACQAAAGNVFLGYSASLESTEVTVTDSYTPTADNENLYAVYQNGQYVLVTDVNQLIDGYKVVIAASGSDYGLGAQNSNNRAAVAIEKGEGCITNLAKYTDAAYELTLDFDGTYYMFYDEFNEKYLYTSGSSNDLKCNENIGENKDKWTISVTEGVATITNVATTERLLQFNESSTLFACYKGTQKAVALYTSPTGMTRSHSNVIYVTSETTLDATSAVGNPDVIIANTGIATFTEDVTLNNLTIKGGQAASGQVIGANKLTITGDAYFDLTLGKEADPNQWHAFAVPFNVDAINGIYDTKNNKLTNEVNYAIMDYHGDVRAEGKYGWKKFRGIMTPGTFYLMTVDGVTKTFRFKMSGNFQVASKNIEVNKYESNVDTDAGWNGIANSQLEYVSIAEKVQVLDPETYTYVAHPASSANFVVGTPFFYQASADVTVVLNSAIEGKPAYAPRMATEAKDIAISFADDNYTDHLYISATNEATDEYQIGRDLVKMTMTNTPTVPQIFAEAYGTKLCMVDAPMMYDEAVYALNLYAPANGEYTIGAAQVDGYEVFLTQYGSVIWNLSMSEATIELTKGNNTEYGLILKATSGHAPTDINTINGQESVQKFLYNSNIYIIRENQKYNAQGIKIQ